MTINWDDSLNTGISIIDEQHKKLFELISNLDKFKGSKDDFTEALLELQIYVSNHFSTEEEYMKSLSYPGYDEHKFKHDEFVAKYYSILKKISSEVDFQTLGDEFIVLLEDWIQRHYTDEDVMLADFIKKSLSD